MVKSNRSEYGVSLLEVLVAVGILSFTFASIYALYGQSLRAVLATNNANLAQAFLVEQGDILRASNWGLLSGTSAGVFPATLLPDPSQQAIDQGGNLNLNRINGTNLFQRLRAYPLLPTQSGTTSIASATPAPTSSPTPIYTITRSGNGARSTYVIPSTTGTLEGMTFVFELQWSEKGRRVSKSSILLLSKKAMK